MADNWQDLAAEDLPIHIVGIGGAGMSALAVLLLERGHRVSGSDLQESPSLERLRTLGIKVTLGHQPQVVAGARVVTASPAVGFDDPELVAAREAGITLLQRADIMGWLTRIRSTLAIAGTHGKTTTTAMAITALRAAGRDPSFLLGADLPHTQQRAHWGTEDLLVVEADESYGSFASMSPLITALGNVEADHLDHYGSAEHLGEAFAALLRRSSQRLVNGDDQGAKAALLALEGNQLGTQEDCSYQITEVSQEGRSSTFMLTGGEERAQFSLGMPGTHNVFNAALAAGAVNLLGVSLAQSAKALEGFCGLDRRFEDRGAAGGVSFIDDYAHLPSEVSATVRAARQATDGRLMVIFQPHRYTRTAAVAKEFAESFVGADHLLITEIYGAGEPAIAGVDAKLVADAVRASQPQFALEILPEGEAMVERLLELLEAGDLCLTLGAGDLTQLPDLLKARLG